MRPGDDPLSGGDVPGTGLAPGPAPSVYQQSTNIHTIIYIIVTSSSSSSSSSSSVYLETQNKRKGQLAVTCARDINDVNYCSLRYKKQRRSLEMIEPSKSQGTI